MPQRVLRVTVRFKDIFAFRTSWTPMSGAGGSGSLARFIRYLGEVNFNQQVLEETADDRDVKVSYGWHRSGYIRLLADENERRLKLPMVPENVARQTELTFSIGGRTVCVWTVAESRQQEYDFFRVDAVYSGRRLARTPRGDYSPRGKA